MCQHNWTAAYFTWLFLSLWRLCLFFFGTFRNGSISSVCCRIFVRCFVSTIQSILLFLMQFYKKKKNKPESGFVCKLLPISLFVFFLFNIISSSIFHLSFSRWWTKRNPILDIKFQRFQFLLVGCSRTNTLQVSVSIFFYFSSILCRLKCLSCPKIQNRLSNNTEKKIRKSLFESKMLCWWYGMK